ncbi:MAG: hypothetical protein NUW01_06730 [Gemmatimonadaceae bacterium]|nr:hypothetical protein [Gemmatimonadaceae bacterium]
MTLTCEVCGAERTYRWDYRPHRFCCKNCYYVSMQGPNFGREMERKPARFVMVADEMVVNTLPWQELAQAARPSAKAAAS